MKRTQCNCDIECLNNFENCKQSLEWLSFHYDINKLQSLRNDYEKLSKVDLNDQQQWMAKQKKQIERDLMRTYPNELFFQSTEGKSALQRLLYTIALYDVKVGYVQGMNFLVGALLFHSEEYIAFWNYVQLYERLELRDIYLENLPGLSKHIQIVQILCMSKQKKLYENLLKNNVQFENFCIPWFLSLLAMVIPIRSYSLVLKPLLQNGWIHVYKLILSYLENCQLSCEGPELLLELSNQINKWNLCIQLAFQVKIDKQFIDLMLSSFDQEKQTFLIK